MRHYPSRLARRLTRACDKWYGDPGYETLRGSRANPMTLGDPKDGEAIAVAYMLLGQVWFRSIDGELVLRRSGE